MATTNVAPPPELTDKERDLLAAYTHDATLRSVEGRLEGVGLGFRLLLDRLETERMEQAESWLAIMLQESLDTAIDELRELATGGREGGGGVMAAQVIALYPAGTDPTTAELVRLIRECARLEKRPPPCWCGPISRLAPVPVNTPICPRHGERREGGDQ